MDLNPTPEQKMLRDAAQKYFRAEYRFDERARYVAQQGVQLHGGVGMTEELDIGHYFLRLTLFEKADGGIDHHLQRFAQRQREELGTPR